MMITVHFAILLCGVCYGLVTENQKNDSDSKNLDLCSGGGKNLPQTYNNTESRKCSCEKNCIRTCCKPGYHFERRTCVLANDTAPLKVSVYAKTSLLEENVTSGFSVGILPCPYFMLDDSDPGDARYIQRDGSMWFPRFLEFISNDLYCIDGQKGGSTFLCFTQSTREIGREINVTGMFISMPFLLATFLIYALLPNRAFHDNALMCYVLSLLLAYVCLVTIQVSEYMEDTLCKCLGFLELLFFLASFLWMNVICFDIWITFKNPYSKGSHGFTGNVKYAEIKKFLLSCLYAWGLAILFIILVFLIDQFGNENSWYHPKVGQKYCFLDDGFGNFLYFYGPMAILVAVNIGLFIMTALKIREIKNSMKMLKENDSRRHTYQNNEDSYRLYLNLMIAMGINWSMEVISWAVNWQTGKIAAPNQAWYLTDLCNALYGVFIFFMFAFKKKIWKKLQERFDNIKGSVETIFTTV